MTLEFEIMGLPRMTNGLRVHWRVIQRERSKWKALVLDAVRLTQKRGAQLDSPLTLAQVTITRYSARQPDYDNLVSSGKAILDGLVEAQVILDDKQSVIGQPKFEWLYAGPRKGKIKVRVESLEQKESA